MSETRTGSASPNPRLRAKRPPSPQATTCVSLSLLSVDRLPRLSGSRPPKLCGLLSSGFGLSVLPGSHHGLLSYPFPFPFFLSSCSPFFFPPLLSFNPIASFFLPFYLLVLGTPPPYLGSCLGSGDRTWDRLSVRRVTFFFHLLSFSRLSTPFNPPLHPFRLAIVSNRGLSLRAAEQPHHGATRHPRSGGPGGAFGG